MKFILSILVAVAAAQAPIAGELVAFPMFSFTFVFAAHLLCCVVVVPGRFACSLDSISLLVSTSHKYTACGTSKCLSTCTRTYLHDGRLCVCAVANDVCATYECPVGQMCQPFMPPCEAPVDGQAVVCEPVPTCVTTHMDCSTVVCPDHACEQGTSPVTFDEECCPVCMPDVPDCSTIECATPVCEEGTSPMFKPGQCCATCEPNF